MLRDAQTLIPTSTFGKLMIRVSPVLKPTMGHCRSSFPWASFASLFYTNPRHRSARCKPPRCGALDERRGGRRQQRCERCGMSSTPSLRVQQGHRSKSTSIASIPATLIYCIYRTEKPTSLRTVSITEIVQFTLFDCYISDSEF
jgi:hypothetical protein